MKYKIETGLQPNLDPSRRVFLKDSAHATVAATIGACGISIIAQRAHAETDLVVKTESGSVRGVTICEIFSALPCVIDAARHAQGGECAIYPPP
jgi:hypothetical protein